MDISPGISLWAGRPTTSRSKTHNRTCKSPLLAYQIQLFYTSEIMRTNLLLLITLLINCLPIYAQAVEVAPRISDREIIESLANLRGDIKELKAGQHALSQRIDDMNQRLDQRIDGMNQQLGQRIEDMSQQLSQRMNLIENLILTMLAAVFALIGYIVWDRKTAMRPLENRLAHIESALEHDLELKSPEGSRLTRLIHALRELAITDEKVASVLRSFSLL